MSSIAGIGWTKKVHIAWKKYQFSMNFHGIPCFSIVFRVYQPLFQAYPGKSPGESWRCPFKFFLKLIPHLHRAISA
jgi:hypothetical protein